MNGLRLDTDKDRYTMGENVAFSVYILNTGNFTLDYRVEAYAVSGRGPFGPVPGWALVFFPGPFSSIPSGGEHLYETLDWAVADDASKSPGVYAIDVRLTYWLPDYRTLRTNATITVFFTLA